MVERVAVLIGTVQLQLVVKIVAPEDVTPEAIEKISLETISDGRSWNWMLLDELAAGTILPLHRDDFVEVRLQRVETLVSGDQQPEILWENEN